jgi:hypothetical protein
LDEWIYFFKNGEIEAVLGLNRIGLEREKIAEAVSYFNRKS